jgi:hypothetical protein
MTGPLQFLPRFRESNWNRHRDQLRRCRAGVLRFRVDGAACADRLVCCLGIFDAGRGLDCDDRAGCTAYIARRWATAPTVDASQLRAHRCPITLRIYLFLVFVFRWPFAIGYPAIAWLCWIPNVIAVELYLHVVPTPSGITLP